jgi:hypothetical protein
MNSLLWICKDFRPFHASFFRNHLFLGDLGLTRIPVDAWNAHLKAQALPSSECYYSQ